MSFAGPADPAIHRSLEAARKKGIVLIAAAGNAGAKSPPLYPAADPNVIAVTATDADDKLFEQSNRGRHIAVAAPGAQILVAIPEWRLRSLVRHLLFGGGSERHRRADARAQGRPHARQSARHPAWRPPRISGPKATTRCSAPASPTPMRAVTADSAPVQPRRCRCRSAASAPARADVPRALAIDLKRRSRTRQHGCQ